MEASEYVKAVKACPRIEWNTRVLEIGKRHSKVVTVRGYDVGFRPGAMHAVVEDRELTDPIWIRDRAHGSTPNRLRGGSLVHASEIRRLP